MAALLGALLSTLLPKAVPALVSGGTKFFGSLLEGKGLPQAIGSGLSAGISTFNDTLKERIPDENYKNFRVETPDIASKYFNPIINTNSSNVNNNPWLIPNTNSRNIMNYVPQANKYTDVPVSAETLDTVSRLEKVPNPCNSNIMNQRSGLHNVILEAPTKHDIVNTPAYNLNKNNRRRTKQMPQVLRASYSFE